MKIFSVSFFRNFMFSDILTNTSPAYSVLNFYISYTKYVKTFQFTDILFLEMNA